MRLVFAIVLTLALAAPAAAQNASAFLRTAVEARPPAPDRTGARLVDPAPSGGGPVVAAPVPPDPRPGRDRALAPYFAALGGAAAWDITETVRGGTHTTEINPGLALAERVGGRAGLATASASLTVLFAALVRAKVYPRSPTRAKVWLVVSTISHVALGFLNRRNHRLALEPGR